jgi:hypothetical protein
MCAFKAMLPLYPYMAPFTQKKRKIKRGKQKRRCKGIGV